ncbi:MAG: YicC family protein [Treponema sp.]|jgi:uncharacterized protein (TIGR00255 family)|nr:YicC family protein [Treponema sp.]
MTGYAFYEAYDEAYSLSVEIKGYNSRYLDISCSLPPAFSPLEIRVRGLIGERFGRGKIDLAVRFKERSSAPLISVNKAVLNAYARALGEIVETIGSDEKPSLALFMGLDGVLTIEKDRDDELNWRRLEPVLVEAMERFDVERVREGRHTEADVLGYIQILEDATKTVASYAPTLEALIRENIRTRFMELLEDAGGAGLGNSIDENRILAETAILLMKYTINEELSRLSSHLAEFRAEIGRNPSPGKKLDFLCQEIHREINTIGSKTPVLEVSHVVVEMKEALENIREQLRNVE